MIIHHNSKKMILKKSHLEKMIFFKESHRNKDFERFKIFAEICIQTEKIILSDYQNNFYKLELVSRILKFFATLIISY